MLPTKFRFIWLSSFREEDFKKSANLKQELPVAAMFANESGQNDQSLQRTSHRCFLPNFSSFGKVVSENIFQKSTNQKQEWPVVVMFVNGSELNEQSIQRTFQGCLIHLAKRLQRRTIFRNQPIRNKNDLWWPCLKTDRDEMSNFIEDLPQMLPTKFRSIWPSSFRGEDF